MMKVRRLSQLGVGAGLATMVLGAMMAIAPMAGANHADPPGFNGTVKIDGLDTNDGPGHSNQPNDPRDDGTDNDPHVDCLLQLEFFNFDHDEVADITITVQPPTARDEVVFFREGVTVSEDDADGAGNDLDETIDLRVHDDVDLTGFNAHPNHGWHVKLEVDIFRELPNGREMVGQKHKVFWIEGCQPTGSISVQKAVTGEGAPDTGVEGEPVYAFTLACESEGEEVDLTPGDDATTTASFSLEDGDVRSFEDLPLGAVCTITETDAQGASTTTMRVGETVLENDEETEDPDGTVTVSEANTAVVVTNDYAVAITPQTGTLSVDKRVTGDGAPASEGAYAFTVSCVDDGQPVDLNGASTEGNDASFTRTPSADPWTSIAMPVGAVCTIAETDAQGASTTTMTVGQVVVDDTSTPARDGRVTVSESNTAVVVTNQYPAVSSTPTELDYSVDVDKLNDADRRGGFRDSETAEDEGDDVQFQITIRNTGDGPLVLQSLTDLVPGRATVDLLGDDVDLVCIGAVSDLRVGSVLPVGSTTVCTFALEDYAPRAGDSLTNTVTVVTDRARDTDTSTVDTEAEVVVLPAPPVVNVPTPAPSTPGAPPAGPTTPVVLPDGAAPVAPVPVVAPAPPAPQVRGDVVTRALPRTGGDGWGMTGMGAFMIAVGAAMVLGSRRRLAR